MEFAKLHALGNDFLILKVDEAGSAGVSLSALARRVCARHHSIGADGVVYYQPTIGDTGAAFSALIFNADGSKAEMSGNGIRCLAAYLAHSGQAVSDAIQIRTVAGIRTCRLQERCRWTYKFEVSMGTPILEPAQVPARLGLGSEPIVDFPLEVGGETVRVTVVSMGNPHCSTFWPDLETAPVDTMGPLIENHKVFPRRTNVEFVQTLGRDRIRVRFWERGVGRTLASGTGSCAAVVASRLRGVVDDSVAVETEGGELSVFYRPSAEVLLTGYAEFIGQGALPVDLPPPEGSQ